MNEKKTDKLITGGIGRKAISTFDDFGVEVITGLKGENVEEVTEKFAKGVVESGENPCDPDGGKGYGNEREDKHR